MASAADLPGVSSGLSGGGLEGAKRLNRETARWNASRASPDQIINVVKAIADARGRDSVQNDGYGTNAVAIHRNSIVGSQYRLTSNPDWNTIGGGATEAWADEFQKVVEARFTLAAESEDNWLDAQRVNTFTGLIRLGIGSFVMMGEVLGSAEWIRESGRPFNTAFQPISPDRLCNPNDMPDTLEMRRGITRDARGKPLSYAIRQGYITDPYGMGQQFQWNIVPARKPWGRKMMIHIKEQLLPDQSRGVADMVSVLKDMHMTKNFKDVTLQAAVIAASYAAAIESELPTEYLQSALGGGVPGAGDNPYSIAIGEYLDSMAAYLGGSNNLRVDGVVIPHLFPGTKLNIKQIGTPGGVGTEFETSLLRHIAAGLGVSYEELAKDYSQVSYSSARTSMANTERFMAARKRSVADRQANDIFALWLEEDWNAGNLPRPAGFSRARFYDPLMKEALCRCTWIGAGAGQIDELKETQAAILRLQSGISTYEIECAKLGKDWREVFTQAARELGIITKLELPFLLNAKRPLGAQEPVDPAAAPAPPGPAPAADPPEPAPKRNRK